MIGFVELSWSLFLLAALAVSIPSLTIRAPQRSGLFAGLVVSAVFLWFLYASGLVYSYDYVEESLAWWPQLDGVWAFHLDPLSVFFALLILGNGALNLNFTQGYYRLSERATPTPQVRRDLANLLRLLVLLMLSLLGLVLADHLLLLFFFWEASTLVTYFLISFNRADREANRGATRMVLVNVFGSAALLPAIWLLQDAGGSYLLSDLMSRGDLVRSAPTYPWILGLTVTAVAAKSALFPFSFWLEATIRSPIPASSAVGMVKAGLFLLARLHPVLGETDVWMATLLILGGGTMLLGAYRGLMRTHAKAIVISLTVAAMGMISALFGLDNEFAIKTALLLLAGQIIYKTALYMAIGVISQRIHVYDVTRMRNLWRLFPWTASAAMAAALSKAGLWPFFGSVKKSGFLEALVYELDLALWLVVPAMLATMFMLVLTLSVGWHPFSSEAPAWLRRSIGGNRRAESPPNSEAVKPAEEGQAGHAHEGYPPTLNMTVPILLLGLAGLVFGVFPRTFLDPWILPATEMVLGRPVVDFEMSPLKDWSKVTTFLGMFGIALGLLLFGARRDIWRTAQRNLRQPMTEVFFDALGRFVLAAGRWTVAQLQPLLVRPAALVTATVIFGAIVWFVGAP
ncbi:MAG: proton-conducting transporter membrane subunit [Opitutales bacterium]